LTNLVFREAIVQPQVTAAGRAPDDSAPAVALASLVSIAWSQFVA